MEACRRRESRARSRGRSLCAVGVGAVPRRRAAGRRPRRPGAHLGVGATCPVDRSRTLPFRVSRRRSPRPTTRSSGSCGCRASSLGRARRRDARAGRRRVPGRVPEPARRPVPARRGRGRGPRRDAGDRVRARDARASICRRSPRSSARPWPSSSTYALGRSAGGRRAPGDARPRRRRRSPRSSRRCRRSSSSSTPTRCRRSTAGSSAGSRRPAGATSCSLLPYVGVASSSSCSTGGCSTCSRSATRRRRRLGVNVPRVRLLVVVAATLGTAAAVAVSGLIGFVGIIVPHAIRLLVGASYRSCCRCRSSSAPGSSSSRTSSRARCCRPPSCRSASSRRSSARRSSPSCCGRAGGRGVIALDSTSRSRLGGAASSTTCRPTVADGRVGRADRAERRRQDDAAARGRRARRRTTGAIELRRRRGLVAAARRSSRGASRSCRRSRVLPPSMTVAEYVLLGRTPHVGPTSGPRARSDVAAVAARARAARPGDPSPAGGSARSAAASGSAPCSRARSRRTRRSCCSTSRRRRSTSAASSRCSSSSTGSAREQRLTVLAAMHDLTLAGQYADRLMLLDGGRRRGRGPAREVLTGGTDRRALRRRRRGRRGTGFRRSPSCPSARRR